MEPRDAQIPAADKAAAAARLTLAAVAAMPAHSDTLALLPDRWARSNLVNDAGHLVTRDARVFQPRPVAFLHKQVAMTDPARLHFDAHLVGPWRRHLLLDHFEGTARTTDLHRRHLCHGWPPSHVFLRGE